MRQATLRWSDRSKPKYISYNPTVLSMVPASSRVLDVGCATGALDQKLRAEKSCFTVGLEVDPLACLHAKNSCDEVVRSDLMRSAYLPFKPSSFDCIVLADVLEHLPDPERLLNLAKSYLRPGGIVVVSVPNVAHWRVRLSLFFGRFDYSDYGILDRTHLRFFTSKSLSNLLNEVGYDILSFRGHGWLWANVMKGLFASAYVVKARPRPQGDQTPETRTS